MKLKSLRLYNFRNHSSLTLEMDSAKVLIYGPNGMGKTNVLEAIYFLTTGRSFRTHRVGEMMAWSQPEMSVEGHFHREEGGTTRLMVQVTPKGRVPYLDGQPAPSWAEYAGRTAVFSFTPWDGWLIKGGGAERRPFLDRAVFSFDSRHWERIERFSRILAHRTALLKQSPMGGSATDSLQAWDPPFAEAAVEVDMARRLFLAQILPYYDEWCLKLLGRPGGVGLGYRSDMPVPEGAREMAPENPSYMEGDMRFFNPFLDSSAWNAAERVQRLIKRLGALRKEEIHRGQCLVGPHRDDLLFFLDGHEMRPFASQGQIRVALLAFRLAQIDLQRRSGRGWPLLLLDDVFSELDPERCRALFLALEELPVQTFITSTQDRPETLDSAGLKKLALGADPS